MCVVGNVTCSKKKIITNLDLFVLGRKLEWDLGGIRNNLTSMVISISVGQLSYKKENINSEIVSAAINVKAIYLVMLPLLSCKR